MTDPAARGQEGPIAPAHRIDIAGSSGYVGRLSANQLAGAGPRCRPWPGTRTPVPTGERISAVTVDVADPGATARALPGADAACSVVHAIPGGTGFEARDRELAVTVGSTAVA